MKQDEARKQWERAAPGWAKWEEETDRYMRPATETMFEMAGVVPGARVIDLACGAGSQTLDAARRVGPRGQVVAADISESMLQYVSQRARDAHLDNVSTLAGAAEELEIPAGSLDAAISRFGLMLFSDPVGALVAIGKGLKPGAKMAAIVFSVPDKNPFMVRPMQILLRHAGKQPPAAGQPGIFALASPGVLQQTFARAGFVDYEQRIMAADLHMRSAADALEMMQQAFGAYRTVISDSPPSVQTAAWAEVAHTLKAFETPNGFEGPIEVIVGVGSRAA